MICFCGKFLLLTHIINILLFIYQAPHFKEEQNANEAKQHLFIMYLLGNRTGITLITFFILNENLYL